MSTEKLSPEYEEFLEFLGEKIQLKGWDKYRGGLDVKSKVFFLHKFWRFSFLNNFCTVDKQR